MVKSYLNNKKLEKVLNNYVEFCNGYNVSDKSKNSDFIQQKNSHDLVLNNKELSDFIKGLNFNEEDSWLPSKNIGLFITKLINNSYQAGFNNFLLDVKDLEPDFLGSYLSSKKEDKINLIINGNVGEYCASMSDGLNVIINGNIDKHLADGLRSSKVEVYGNVDDFCASLRGCSHYIRPIIDSKMVIHGSVGMGFAFQAENSYFKVMKDAYGYIGICSNNCDFEIYGNAGIDVGSRSENSKFFLNGEVGPNCGNEALNSVFNVRDKEVYRKLLSSISSDKENNVYLV